MISRTKSIVLIIIILLAYPAAALAADTIHVCDGTFQFHACDDGQVKAEISDIPPISRYKAEGLYEPAKSESTESSTAGDARAQYGFREQSRAQQEKTQQEKTQWSRMDQSRSASSIDSLSDLDQETKNLQRSLSDILDHEGVGAAKATVSRLGAQANQICTRELYDSKRNAKINCDLIRQRIASMNRAVFDRTAAKVRG